MSHCILIDIIESCSFYYGTVKTLCRRIENSHVVFRAFLIGRSYSAKCALRQSTANYIYRFLGLWSFIYLDNEYCLPIYYFSLYLGTNAYIEH